MVQQVATARIPEEAVAVGEVTVRRAALLRRVSWGAVIAGTVTALMIQLIFTTLGAAIGLALVNPSRSGEGIAMGAGIWWLVTGLMSLFIGGAVCGRLAGFPQRVEAALHGVLVWALSGIIGIFVLSTSAAALIGGALSPMSRSYADYNAYSSTYSSRNAATSGLSLMGQHAIDEINRLPAKTKVSGGPEDTNPPATAANAPQTTPPSLTGTPPTDRPEIGSQPGASTQTMSDQEKKDAARALAGAAMWSFFALLLGSGAGCIGGQVGRPPLGVSLE
jgi:hypothetical protein